MSLHLLRVAHTRDCTPRAHTHTKIMMNFFFACNNTTQKPSESPKLNHHQTHNNLPNFVERPNVSFCSLQRYIHNCGIILELVGCGCNRKAHNLTHSKLNKHKFKVNCSRHLDVTMRYIYYFRIVFLLLFVCCFLFFVFLFICLFRYESISLALSICCSVWYYFP